MITDEACWNLINLLIGHSNDVDYVRLDKFFIILDENEIINRKTTYHDNFISISNKRNKKGSFELLYNISKPKMFKIYIKTVDDKFGDSTLFEYLYYYLRYHPYLLKYVYSNSEYDLKLLLEQVKIPLINTDYLNIINKFCDVNYQYKYDN